MELQVAWSDMADMMDLPYADMHATAHISTGGSAVGTGGTVAGTGATSYNGFHARTPPEAKWQPDEPASPRSNGGSGKHGSPPHVAGSQCVDDSPDDELYQAWPHVALKGRVNPGGAWPSEGARAKPGWDDARRSFAQAHVEPPPPRKRKFWEHEEVADRKEPRCGSRKGAAGSPSGRMSASWELADNLAADLDGSLSGLGVDLSTASYNMSDALLALPSLSGLKQEAASPTSLAPSHADNGHGVREADSNTGGGGGNAKEAPSFRGAALDRGALHQLLQPGAKTAAASSTTSALHDLGIDCRFQYVLAAATSIATKVTEETLTYLNQGQSYEIKLKKLGELSAYRGRILKSVIRICFHERRLQYMETEQMSAWRASRPGERIVEVDVPLSYGVCEVNQDPWLINTVDFLWDPTKEVGVYVKVNCISTEFTPKKHGGEKGVPFRIQVETYLQGDAGLARLHAAACQIKVFKLKGGDRKHKQDREKILKRPSSEHDKFQPSYDCTVLNDVPVELVFPAQSGSALVSSSSIQPALSPQENNRPCVGGVGPTDVPVDEEAGSHVAADQHSVHSLQDSPDLSATAVGQVSCDWPPQATAAWLAANRFAPFARLLAGFSGADLLRLSRDDLTQICGLADGIRLFNAVHARCVGAVLTLYVSADASVPDPAYRALYLRTANAAALRAALASALGLGVARVSALHVAGPAGIRVLVTDDLVAHLNDDAVFAMVITPDASGDRFQVLLKPVCHT